jgi:hypothetical protein
LPRHARRGAFVRLSATVTPKFFPLYHFFPLFSSLFFHLLQRFPLNTPPILHYHYKISFSIPTINFLSTNNYSWTHSTVFRVMNSDTLDLGGERRGPTCRGRCRGTAAAIGCPLQPSWKGRGSGRVDRCGQSYTRPQPTHARRPPFPPLVLASSFFASSAPRSRSPLRRLASTLPLPAPPIGLPPVAGRRRARSSQVRPGSLACTSSYYFPSFRGSVAVGCSARLCRSWGNAPG